MAGDLAPFYFVVVVWGKEHREYFLRLLVPSLLAPGNIPSLENASASRFLICTTRADWLAMQADADFSALEKAITTEWLEIAEPKAGDNKYLVMSTGHKLATRRAFEARALGVFLTPDCILSDGSVITLQRYARAGNRLVLCAAMRFTNEGAIEEISRTRKAKGEALNLPPRLLVDIALRNMHDETLRYEWDAPYFATMPFCLFWNIPDEGILVHSLTWAPFVAAYNTIDVHDTTTLDNWTMDGDYIHRNFGADPTLQVLADSDELMLVTLTPKADRPGNLEEDALAHRWHCRWPIIGHYWKISRLRWMLESANVDPLKRRLLSKPVQWHRQYVTAALWEAAEKRAQAIIQEALASPKIREKLSLRLIRLIQSLTIWPFTLIHRPEPAMPVLAINRRILNQSEVGTFRVQRLGPLLQRGRWYWEVFSPNIGRGGIQVARTSVVGAVGEDHSLHHEIGRCGPGWGWRGDGVLVENRHQKIAGTQCDGPDEVLMVALDMDAGRMWFGRNGMWFDNGDPASGQGSGIGGIDIPVYAAVSSMHGPAGTAELNSCVTRASLRYRPPSGFLPLAEAPIEQSPLSSA